MADAERKHSGILRHRFKPSTWRGSADASELADGSAAIHANRYQGLNVHSGSVRDSDTDEARLP